MSDTDLKKHREILFAKFPPGQVPEAADQLRRLDDLAAEAHCERRTVGVDYALTQHTLQELEGHLEDQGYHLDNTLLSKLTRALIHYVEETQSHNLKAPEKRIKRSAQEAYGKAWERHLHGDQDDTPPEWREYK